MLNSILAYLTLLLPSWVHAEGFQEIASNRSAFDKKEVTLSGEVSEIKDSGDKYKSFRVVSFYLNEKPYKIRVSYYLHDRGKPLNSSFPCTEGQRATVRGALRGSPTSNYLGSVDIKITTGLGCRPDEPPPAAPVAVTSSAPESAPATVPPVVSPAKTPTSALRSESSGGSVSTADPIKAQEGNYFGIIPVFSQKIGFDFPQSWTPHSQRQGRVYLMEFIPSGQTLETWREMITLMGLQDGASVTPESVLQGEKELVRKHCPEAFHAQDLPSPSHQGYLSRRFIAGCGKTQNSNSEYGLYFYVWGKRDLYMLKRSIRGLNQPPNVETGFGKELFQAKICVKDSSPVRCEREDSPSVWKTK